MSRLVARRLHITPYQTKADTMKALSRKTYVSLALAFVGIAPGGFLALIALDRLLGGQLLNLLLAPEAP